MLAKGDRKRLDPVQRQLFIRAPVENIQGNILQI
jgi:hypothetical protein